MPGVVTVACKIPNGIVLRAFVMIKQVELMQGGVTREVQVATPKGEPQIIIGPGRLDKVHGVHKPIASGYALTPNVDADVWDAWLAANRDTDMVRNELIMAHAKPNEVSAKARENEKRRTGLEPMDPDGDARMPKRRQTTRGGAISELETAKVG